jgi:predicted nucleotidyltransferase
VCTTLSLNPEDYNTVLAILHRIVPESRVLAFGSRVQGNHRLFSDLDLAIQGPQALSLATMSDLREAFSQSDLPIRIDFLDWAMLDDSFRQIIRENHVVIQEGKIGDKT